MPIRKVKTKMLASGNFSVGKPKA